MPSLRDIKKRIGSVKNTQKITRAMKMVAASKLRRAQNNLSMMSRYMLEFGKIIGTLKESVDFTQYKLVKRNETKDVTLILMTGDKGLCGSFNANLIACCERTIAEYKGKGLNPSLITIGKKGRDSRKKLNVEIKNSFSMDEVFKDNVYVTITHSLMTDFLEGKNSIVSIMYGHFNSAISNTPRVLTLLPLDINTNENHVPSYQNEPLFEPNKNEVMTSLLEQYIRNTFYMTLVNTFVSEISSRMIAMDSATNNAKELIGKLALDYNRKRQATITKEMLEIIGGKEALTN